MAVPAITPIRLAVPAPQRPTVAARITQGLMVAEEDRDHIRRALPIQAAEVPVHTLPAPAPLVRRLILQVVAAAEVSPDRAVLRVRLLPQVPAVGAGDARSKHGFRAGLL